MPSVLKQRHVTWAENPDGTLRVLIDESPDFKLDDIWAEKGQTQVGEGTLPIEADILSRPMDISVEPELPHQDNLVPVLEAELYDEIEADEKKKKALEKYLLEHRAKTYADLVREQIRLRLVNSMRNLLEAMQGKYLDEFKKDEDFSKMLASFEGQEEPDYQTVVNLCQILEKVANAKKDEYDKLHHADAKSYNNIKRTMDQLGVLYKFDVPRIVNVANKAFTLDENYHYTKRKKKSWFKRLWDRVKRLFTGKVKEAIELEELKLGSLEKAATKLVTKSVAGSFENNANDYINALKADKVAQQQEGRIDYKPVAKAAAPEKEGISKKGAAKGVVSALGKGVIQQASSWVFGENQLSSYLEADKEVTSTNLSQHIEQAFTYEAKKQAFESLAGFIRDAYAIYETSERMRGNHPQSGVNLEKIGFGRLQDAEFKEFMLSLSTALGFDLEAYRQAHPEHAVKDDFALGVHLLYYADDVTRAEAFKQFIQGNDEKGIGLKFAAYSFNNEYDNLKKANVETKSSSTNYFYLLDLNKQLLEDLSTKTITHNAIQAALKAGHIEERVYNPEAKGMGTAISSQLKEKLVGALPTCMESYLGDAIKKQELSQAACQAHLEGILEAYSQKMEELYPPEEDKEPDAALTTTEPKGLLSQVNEKFWGFLGYSSKPSKQAHLGKPLSEELEKRAQTPTAERKEKAPTPATSVSERERAWKGAQEKLDEVGIPKLGGSELMDLVKNKTNQKWQKAAQDSVKNIIDWGGLEFINSLHHELTKQFVELEDKQAHKVFKEEVTDKLQALVNYLSEGKKIESMDFEEFRGFFEALRAGVNLKYNNQDFKNIDEKSDLYMLMMGLNQLNSVYITPELGLRIYEDIVQTEYGQTPSEELTGLKKTIIKKVVSEADKMFIEAMSTNVTQMNYFLKQRKEGKHFLAIDETATLSEPEAEVETWSAWGWNKLYNVAGYVGMAATPAIEAKNIAAEGLMDYAYQRITGETLNTPEDLNTALVDGTKEYIRGTTYDAVFDMVNDLYGMIEFNEEFARTNKMSIDISEFGFESKESLLKFLNKAAKDLGYEEATLGEKALSPIEHLHQMAKTKDHRYETKKANFSRVRKDMADKYKDPFVGLKSTIRDENERVTKLAKKGKLKNGTNYLVIMTSLNGMIDSVETVQRETLAAELLMPDLGEKMGLDSQQEGLWNALKQAAKVRATDYLKEGVRQGVAYQLSESIQRLQDFSKGIVSATQQNMEWQLKGKFEHYVLDEKELKRILTNVQKPQDLISVFNLVPDSKITEQTILQLGEYIVNENRIDFLPALLQLNKVSMEADPELTPDQYDDEELSVISNIVNYAIQHSNLSYVRYLIDDTTDPNISEMVKDMVQEAILDEENGYAFDSLMAYMAAENFEIDEDMVKAIKFLKDDPAFSGYDTQMKSVTRSWGMTDNDKPVLEEVRDGYLYLEHLSHFIQGKLSYYSNLSNDLAESSESKPPSYTQLLEIHQQLELLEILNNKIDTLKQSWVDKNPTVQKHLGNYKGKFQNEERADGYMESWDEALDELKEQTSEKIASAKQALDSLEQKYPLQEAWQKQRLIQGPSPTGPMLLLQDQTLKQKEALEQEEGLEKRQSRVLRT